MFSRTQEIWRWRRLVAAAGLCAVGQWGLLGQDDCLGREWTDASGSFSVEAELISVAEGKLVLLRRDGRRIEVSAERLSEEDQQYVRDWLEHEKQLQPLLKQTRSDNADARSKAVQELGDLGEEAAPAAPRLTELLSDENSSVRFYAARSLGQIGPPAAPATDKLLELVRSKDNASLVAARALQNIGIAAQPQFVAAMKDDHPVVRELAASVIGKAGDEMRDVYLPLFDSDDPNLREAALIALLSSGPPPEERLARCRAALADPQEQVRIRGCYGLNSLGDHALPALDALLALAAGNDESNDMRRTAVRTVQAIAPHDPRFLPVVLEYLQLHDNDAIVQDVVRDVGPVAVEPLAQLLDSEDPKTRIAAATALGELYSARPQALPGLLKMIEHPEAPQRYTALATLATFGPAVRPFQEKLIEKLEDSSMDVRKRAVQALAQAALPPDKVVPLLVAQLDDESTVLDALQALGAMGPAAKAALPKIRELADGENSYVAKFARQAVRRIEAPIDFSFQAHTDKVLTLAYTPDGKSLISAGKVQPYVGPIVLAVWDAADGARERALSVGLHTIDTVVHNRDASIVAAERLRTVMVFDGRSGVPLARWKLREIVDGLALSPDGALLATSDIEDDIQIWQAATGRRATDSTIDDSWVMEFLPDGKRLATPRGDAIDLWDVASGELNASLPGHDENVNDCLDFSQDGKLVASGAGGSVKVWDLTTRKRLQAIENAHEEGVWDVSLSPDGERVASCGQDGLVHVWSIATGEKLHTLEGEEGVAVVRVAFRPVGGQLAVGDEKGYLRVWTPK
ncbi:MAG: HEAT repeat domain-containing protein [Pirellulaceae bacterium]